MKQSVLGGLTVAVVLSAFGAPLPGYAQTADDRRLSSDASVDAEVPLSDVPSFDVASSDVSPSDLTAEAGLLNPSAPPFQAPTEAERVSRWQVSSPEEGSAALPSSPTPNQDFSEIATILPHALDENQAATVYIRSIPVVTLIGAELASLGGSKSAHVDPADRHADPVLRANAVVERLLELAESADAHDIQARWDADQSAYVVAWNDENLVTVNSRTILPDTTQDPAEDALQMANRLRRLLGDAPALARVEGMPAPVAPAPRMGVVTSTLTGMASWYGPGFHGRRSASGEVFNQNALTAAHRTLPFGTQVRVTNLNNGQQVVVRINDRGPFGHGRVIDLSAAAASSIGLRASGVGRVQIEVLSTP